MQIRNRVIFMGTPKIAAVCLAAILEQKDYDVVAVVCQPDKPVGRHKEITFCPVKQLALDHNIKVLQDAKVSNLYEQIKTLNPDLIFTCAFGQFIPSNILDLPQYKCVNLHASLLPKLRGGAPIQWAIINQDKETGFTLMYMDKKMDAGNIIKQYPIGIDPQETYASLYDKLCVLAGEVISKDFKILFNKNLQSTSQDESKATFGYNITRENEKIDWSKSNLEVDALIRGLYNVPIAYTTFDNQIIKIHKATPVDGYRQEKPGTIVQLTNQMMIVACGTGSIKLELIQMAGKKPLLINQIVNGNHPFKVGKQFN
ncbi:MAG: methionyl-tRNA formyltransferase [Mycoplasmoidaceae bacterium]